MNTLKKTLLLTLFVIVFISCVSIRQPVATLAPDNNKAYQVDYLFEHDGCKVYRFLDMGQYVYFTNCTGDVTSIKKDSTETRVINQIRNNPPK